MVFAYTAVIECVPRFRDEVVKVAIPEAFSDTDARLVAPSLNKTLPPGMPAGEVTVAVKVTNC